MTSSTFGVGSIQHVDMRIQVLRVVWQVPRVWPDGVGHGKGKSDERLLGVSSPFIVLSLVWQADGRVRHHGSLTARMAASALSTGNSLSLRVYLHFFSSTPLTFPYRSHYSLEEPRYLSSPEPKRMVPSTTRRPRRRVQMPCAAHSYMNRHHSCPH
jgi:hypothetical protein